MWPSYAATCERLVPEVLLEGSNSRRVNGGEAMGLERMTLVAFHGMTYV
jgi:hypothetical protein